MSTLEKRVRPSTGLASELRFAVTRLRRRLASERDPDNDLSVPAMAVLWALHRAGDLTVGTLAGRERVQPPSMTRTVTALADDGYVERHPHPSDGRQVVVRLTDAGRAVLLADAARRDQWLSRQLASLTAADRDVLRRALPVLQRLAEAD